MNDFNNAVTTANTFDSQVANDAGPYGTGYVGLVELSVRQFFGAVEITISKTSSGRSTPGNFQSEGRRTAMDHENFLRNQVSWSTLGYGELSRNLSRRLGGRALAEFARSHRAMPQLAPGSSCDLSNSTSDSASRICLPITQMCTAGCAPQTSVKVLSVICARI